IPARFVFSADEDIEDKVRRGEFRQDLFFRISSYKIHVPPLRERKNDILPLVLFFARRAGLQVNISPEGMKGLKSYRWTGNIREIENFIHNLSVVGSKLDDEGIYSLHRHSGDLLESVKISDMPLSEMEKKYILFLLKKYRSKVRVADILKISRKSLYNKLKKYEND
ncbi:MAG: sigma 54-interacting transcriptional regulator, partial [Candidatus Aminicenantes bacterium]|nr:sigma 54-interacting transcriptional regulator [Candidatus Aminicenantes bacterium]